ncbi:MnmC family methyltransferase [Sulfurovum sp. zt1-1]|uniref:MnmC family methyltransferase n=1 Tax=Sulfurovum zhangzhouensis TaxID=3019067 RepID=A0ABT7QZS7_9BACT|nr:MnmC family methyltransferase [Sulfurovum zhangzhouensis]MDM5272288.1 MnmC family methyltransferase [Sulfurovum zhangzhouensis]
MGSGYDESLRGQKEVIVTEDGSMTLYSKEFDQAYHSTKDGALQESLQKHVIPAFSLQKYKDKLTILDICFGLGYNTLATLYYVKLNHLDTKVHIISPEFDRELVESLSTFEYPKEFDSFKPIIRELSQNFCYEDEQFKIEVLIGDAREVIPKISEKIDIVYQDAFSPKQNPLLWTKEYFHDIRVICNDDAIITTYSTAIATRMGLYENGFEIFIYYGEEARRSTIASPQMIEGLEYVDMELKKQRNKDARSISDKEFQ